MPDSSPRPSPNKRRPRKRPWQITWLGLGLAIALWIGPRAYYQKMHQLLVIEYQSGEISEADYLKIIRRHAQYSIAAKIAAGITSLGSVLYLLSQSELRGRRER